MFSIVSIVYKHKVRYKIVTSSYKLQITSAWIVLVFNAGACYWVTAGFRSSARHGHMLQHKNNKEV